MEDLHEDSYIDIGHSSGPARNRYHYFHCPLHGYRGGRGGGANCCSLSVQCFMCRKDENQFRQVGQILLDTGAVTEAWFAEQLELLEANVWRKPDLDPRRLKVHRYCKYHDQNEPLYLCGSCKNLHCCGQDSPRCGYHPSNHMDSVLQVQKNEPLVNHNPGENMDDRYYLYTVYAYDKESGVIHDVSSPITAHGDAGARNAVLKQLVVANNEFDVDDPNLIIVANKI